MRSILVISKVCEEIKKIHKAFLSTYNVDEVSKYDNIFEILQKKRYDFILIDLEILIRNSQGKNFQEIIQVFKNRYPTTQIIVMSPQALIRMAVQMVKAGASDYLTYPIDPVEVKLVFETIQDSIIKQSELDYLRDQLWKSEALHIFSSHSQLMQEVFKKIRLVAPTKTTVLLNGETGTGKGVLARLIHQSSNRQNTQFISIHCGAIPDNLLESELFGHEKGAFTGAIRKKLGKFEIAKGGTIFLDEVGTITPSAQIKLLQVLQDSIFSRVGGEEIIEANARIIAATNSDLKQMCEKDLFRRDLYYRLNVFPIEIPPLRERPKDIPLFIDVFLKKLNQKYEKNIHKVHPSIFTTLQTYFWPGNIRELENLLERAYILETSSMLTPESFPSELFEPQASTAVFQMDSFLALAQARRKAIEDFERQYLKELVMRNKGKINESATEAGISTRQLHKLMLKHGIRKEEFKISP